MDRRKPFPPFYFLSLLSEGGRELDVCWLEKGYEFLFLYEKKGGSRGRGKNEIKNSHYSSSFFCLSSPFCRIVSGLCLRTFPSFLSAWLGKIKRPFISPLFSFENFLFVNISEHPLICLEKFF